LFAAGWVATGFGLVSTGFGLGATAPFGPRFARANGGSIAAVTAPDTDELVAAAT